MAKKFRGENSKVTAAKDRKAKAQAEKDKEKRAAQESKESAAWSAGAKKLDKKEAEMAKRAEKLARKQEAAKLLQEEEKQLGKTKPALKPTARKPATGAAKIAQKKAAKVETFQQENKAPEASYSARNIDDALDLLDIVHAPSGDVEPTPGDTSPKPKASTANVAIDRHPERRHKAAYTAYEARELPRLKEENKGLRLNQIKQIMWKNWQKSPENPFNQVYVAYNASQRDQEALVEEQRQRIESRLRVD
ncbi:hypothetical protein IWQ62_003605 [Dispira parvispora]|uniref:HMG box domain-containing protein n=1 Tax=Dispira parvispora TaxID=1520584 RepID=A0A9W8ANF3_9FUNG|nr:hypothetical protein IWQ62_003605 [Dispira parvispora]